MLDRRPLCEEEKRLPYAKYYDILLDGKHPGDDRLLARPLKPEETLPISEALQMIRSDGSYPEHNTGYCVLPDGRTYMACMQFLPGVTPLMMDWYFKWMGTRPGCVPEGHGNLRYKIWCPEGHWDLVDLDKEPAQRAMIRESLDLEKEAPMIHIHVRRFPLSVIGVTEKMQEQIKARGDFMTLEAGMSPDGEPGGLGINFFRKREDGCDWISRSWGGYAVKDGQIVQIPAGPVPDYESMQTELLHNLTERRQLPKFLPQLYREYGDRPFDED